MTDSAFDWAPREEPTAPRGLPANLEAEQMLIGGILYDADAMDGAEGLTAADFFEPLHGRLFASIAARIQSGRLVDPTMLMREFAGDPAFEELGGVTYLANMTEKALGPRYAQGFADEIKSASMGRRLIQVVDDIEAVATSGKLAKDQLQEAERLLYGIADQTPGANGFISFADSVRKALAAANEAHMRDGSIPGVSTGLIDLDAKLGGLHRSDLSILAGRPSMGKSALATNIAVSAARQGMRVGIFSLEMSDEQLATRVLAEFAGVSSDRIRKGETTPAEMARLADAAEELERLPIYIDPEGGIAISKLVGRSRRLKRRQGLDLVIVDYLQLATDQEKRRGGNRTEEVSSITMALKALAKELNIPVLALAQLSRQVESREDKRPQLSDLRESGSIEQDADVVMFVYREAYYLARSEPQEGGDKHLEWQSKMFDAQGKAEVIIGKQRHGPIGTVRLSFNEELTKFGNLARDGRYSHHEANGSRTRLAYREAE